MDEERRKVLEMVAAGTITPDEANQLLEVLEGGGGDEARDPVAAGYAGAGRQEAPPRGPAAWQAFEGWGANAAFARGMREAGLDDLAPARLRELRRHGVKPEYVRELRESGFADVSIDNLIDLSNHGVKPGYVREVREAGVDDLDYVDLIVMRNQWVKPYDIR